MGQYFAERGPISAANYFSADGIRKIEYAENEFGVCFEKDGAFLQYPNVLHIPSDAGLKLSFSGTCETAFPLVLELQTGENMQTTQAELIPGSQEIYVPLTLENERLDSLTLRFPRKAKNLILTQLSFVS